MEHVLNHLREANRGALQENQDCKVKLLVFAKNPAVHLYERLGFSRVNTIATPKLAKAFGDPYNVLVRMGKAL